MTATGKPATAPDKSKTVKKKRSSAPRGSKKTATGDPRKTSKPSVPAKRKRTARRKADPAVSSGTRAGRIGTIVWPTDSASRYPSPVEPVAG